MSDWPDPPEKLKQRDIWLIWGYEEREDADGETHETKVPLDPHDGRRGDATDAEKCTDFESAAAACERFDAASGIGYTFLPNDLLAGVDLDDVRDPETGDLTKFARGVVTDLDSYTEVSPSGTGVHVVVLGFKAGERCRTAIGGGESEIEIYDEDRFFTYTGETLGEGFGSVEQRNDALTAVYEDAFGVDTAADAEAGDVEAPDLDLDDEQVLEKARNAKNGDKFERLERGDDSAHAGDTSRADQAFVNYLAFWTGGDRRQIDRLFRASGRMRPKWDPDNHSSYQKQTIDTALSGRTEFYEPSKTRDRPPEFDPETGNESTSAESAETDGGAVAAENTESTGADRSLDLSPMAVMAEAGLDPDDGSLNDIADREKAYRVWSLIERADDEHLLAAQPDGTVFWLEDGVWDDEGEQRLRELGRPALGPAYSKNVLTELVEQVRAAAPLPRASMGTPPGTVAVSNGLLDLESGGLRPLEAGDYAMFRADAKYDPDAECPRFREFVEDVVREGDLATLQEYAGYTLLHWGQPYKRAMLLLGPQDSGKSTFLNVLKSVLGGQDNVSAENLDSLVNSRWGTASLFGKTANITNELETKKLESVGLFKTLTGGGDTISAEFKGRDKFEFAPTAKQMFATNQVPPTENTDDAFFSRWVFASFPESVPVSKQVADLDEKMLNEERSGILNWMIEGYNRLQEQGGFSNDPMSGQKRERWEAYGDSIKRFKHNCLETTGDSGDAVAKNIAHQLYAVYCREKIGSEVKPQQTLTSELKKDDKIGDSKRKLHPEDKRRKAYTGVRFHPDALDALDFDPGARLADLREDADEDDEDDGPDETSLSGFGE